MRQIQEGLRNLFEPLDAKFIKQQCKNDGDREVDQQFEHAEHNRVGENIPELAAVEQLFEMSEIIEGTAENALFEAEILKRHNDAVHGNVLENQQVCQAGNAHQVKPAVLVEVL